MSPRLTLRVNGEPREAEPGTTLADYLAALGVDPARTVAEVNGVVVERARFGEIGLREGDRLELVRFVGGG